MSAGGVWTNQNKIRPGVYIRYKSKKSTGLTVGERGTVTIPKALSWGPEGQLMTIEAGADMTAYTGYDLTHEKNRFLLELFKGTNRTAAPTKVLLYRLAATGSAAAKAAIAPLTVTAQYPGVRGNELTIVISELTNPENSFSVSTVVDGSVADQQTAATVEELTDNAWVHFSGTGALAATAGTPLTGGADGTVDAAAYSKYLAAIEPYKFDVLIYDGDNSIVKTAMQTFIKRVCENTGMYAQLVEANATNPDSRYVINVCSGAVMDDGMVFTPEQVTWWVGGAQAGAKYNENLTNAAYPGAVDITPALTQSQYEAALTEGKFVLNAENRTVRVEKDINSLVSYTPDIGDEYVSNRVMRLCNTIANDLKTQFSANFIGVTDNEEDGRGQFKSATVKYLQDIQSNKGIQNFDPENGVSVLPGDAIDAITVDLDIKVVESVNRIYMTVNVA